MIPKSGNRFSDQIMHKSKCMILKGFMRIIDGRA